MGSVYRLSLLAILFITFTTPAVLGFEHRPKNIGRFKSKHAIIDLDVKPNLTEAEAHAKWLTSRKPTRRRSVGTAQRRQVSVVPAGDSTGRLAALDATGTPVGSLTFSDSSWTISSTGDGSIVSYGGILAARDTRDAQRLVYAAPDRSYPYKYFGIGQCNIGSPIYIGSGSANVLCLVNSASATRAGALPTFVKNSLDTTGASYVETDVWTLDSSTQTAAAVWINPDGSSASAHIVAAVNNPYIIFITGDAAATSALYGIEFRTITLKYTNLY